MKSLDTSMRIEKETEKLELAAQTFRKLVPRNIRGAREYFWTLDGNEQEYIRLHYGIYIKALRVFS